MCKWTSKYPSLFEIFKNEQNFINIGIGNVFPAFANATAGKPSFLLCVRVLLYDLEITLFTLKTVYERHPFV